MFALAPRRWSVRVRLTLWYAATLAVAMIVLTTTMYVVMRRTLEHGFETDLSNNAASLGARLEHELDEGDAPDLASASTVRKSQFHDLWLEVYDPTGRRIAASDDLGDHSLGVGLDVARLARPIADPALVSLDGTEIDPAGVELAVVSVPRRQTGDQYVLVAGAGRGAMERALALLRRLSFTLVPLLVALAALGGWLLARRALEPVAAMAEQARRMGADRLTERLAVSNPNDELGALAATFNELLDRIASSVERMRSFVADALHELRTPVAVMRSGAAVALTPPVTLDEATETLEVVRDQTERLSRLVDDMFLLARADAGDPGMLRREAVPIADLAASCARAAESLGHASGVEVVFSSTAKVDVVCLGDRARLEQMLMNLLANAVRYAGRGGRVGVRAGVVERKGNMLATVTVTDTGPGIPESHREAVFERFVRIDRARARETGGSGLGLPIARWIAESHGGSLDLEDAPGSGCAFTVRLPVTAAVGAQGEVDRRRNDEREHERERETADHGDRQRL